MTIEELEKKRNEAYDRLKPIEEGAPYEDMYYAYNRAFDIVDEALEDAIKHLKLLEQVVESIELAPIKVKN